MALARTSLPDQTAAFLREGISTMRWSRELPGELELCRELHVSRSTLRKAIQQLVHEGLLEFGGHRRHHRIRKKPRRKVATTGRIVRLLTPFSERALGSIQHELLDRLAERLVAAGLDFEYEHRPALFKRHSAEELKRIWALPDTAALIIAFSNRQMQHWVVQNKVPCVIWGRLHGDLEIPCFYPDCEPIGRHAAGLFHQRGHREMAYFRAGLTSLNDQLATEAFASEAHRLGARCHAVIHEDDPADIKNKLDLLLAGRPRVTAFFSTCPEHNLTILGHLINTGLRVPEDASLISGWDDEFLHYAVPRFANYRIDGARLGAIAARIVLDLIRHGQGAGTRRASLLPAFVSGETLGPAPRAARPGQRRS
jgi:DNA-binding LacI/PurR family transcriptional regulator